MTVFLNSLGMINALGTSLPEISQHLFTGQSSSIKPYTSLLSGRDTWVGQVDSALPRIPAHLSKYDCRNNQLLAAA